MRVYKQTFSYKFRPVRLPGKTPYGPFEIELGEIEGRQKYSLLSPEEYDVMDEKPRSLEDYIFIEIILGSYLMVEQITTFLNLRNVDLKVQGTISLVIVICMDI